MCFYCTEKDPSDLSLDKYLSKHTSEDNESFGEIMKEAERKHKIKHAWLFEQQQEKSEVYSKASKTYYIIRNLPLEKPCSYSVNVEILVPDLSFVWQI